MKTLLQTILLSLMLSGVLSIGIYELYLKEPKPKTETTSIPADSLTSTHSDTIPTDSTNRINPVDK